MGEMVSHCGSRSFIKATNVYTKHFAYVYTTPLPKYTSVQFLLDLFGTGEFFPNDALIDWLAEHVCPFDKELEIYCRDVMFLICGFDTHNINVVSTQKREGGRWGGREEGGE